MPAAALVDAHRADLDELIRLSLADLGALFTVTVAADELRDLLIDALPQLVGVYGAAAATLAADWYDEARDAERVRSRFRAIPAILPDTGRTDALARWGVAPLYSDTPNLAVARSKIDGGFQRIIADAARDTVIGSLAADPDGRGWSRQTTGKSCDFCVMIAGRGAVYSARTADFASHDDCDCIAVPEFGGDRRQVRAYTPSQRPRNAKKPEKPLDTTPGSFDATRSVEQLRGTVASLERSLAKFDSPATRARIADLKREIASRS